MGVIKRLLEDSRHWSNLTVGQPIGAGENRAEIVERIGK
jgi:hypothetical protein